MSDLRRVQHCVRVSSDLESGRASGQNELFKLSERQNISLLCGGGSGGGGGGGGGLFHRSLWCMDKRRRPLPSA